ncbi:lauroyl-Kdo(2)-lipid IV(A) myristoyltransferase [Psychromonas antarctica]|jgi:lauroyl-KDO2-lipid IV(A) myristoyltransferase|uniref:LpxL/LpxP family acyltransferase n=1 Tax=Psychromonas antarctica TaxID=67573 RepID=UPI001EE7C515|nr:lauroyl-Kdo(2)-lipid IV(A) myristoyltransferase [Psychromonas antarctica]MCG6200602.1 lauroyl-Kdo(2)-lipid IV(A) myristoyltransferase [Psychromonas antarctica]
MTLYSSRFDTSLKAKHFMPKYWGTWSLLGFLYICSYCPIKIRDRFAAFVVDKLYNASFLNKRKKIAFTNLSLCFPEYTQQQKESLMRENLRAVAQISLSLGELAFRSQSFLVNRVNMIGEHYIKQAEAKKQAIIFLGPHCYGIDFAGVAAIAARGYALSSMFNDYKNPIFDWFVTGYRTRFTKLVGKGMLYHRSEGLKPAIKSLRDKAHFYYLPDEDHGRDHSLFANFYATQKATLPIIGRLAKLGRAVVIPVYTSYNAATSKVDVIFHAPLDDFSKLDEQAQTELMNRAIEKLIDENRAQYMWALKLLKTRPEVGLKIYK